MTFALLGRSAQAHRACDRVTALLPLERDAALDQVEWMLSLPAGLSRPWLRVEYQLAPLRGHPRFTALVDARP